MLKKHLFPFLVIIIIASSFLTSMAVVAKLNGGTIMSAVTGGSYASGFTDGMNAAKKKLADSGVFPSVSETKTISGTVKSVGDKQLVITVRQISRNPLDEQGPSERTVVINDETKITKQIPLTPEERAAAMNAYQENVKAGKQGTRPLPFDSEKATFGDIAIGMNVTVTAADNIKDAATINATAIEFESVPDVANKATPTKPPTTIPPATESVPKAPTPIPNR